MYGTRLVCILSFCCCLTVSTSLTSSAEKSDAVLTKILSDWKARQKIADSVLYEIEGHVVAPRGSYPENPDNPGVSPIKDSEYDVSTELLLDFRNNRIRRTHAGEVVCTPTLSFIPTYEIDIYDGQEFFKYEPRDKNTSDRWTPDEYDIELHLTGQTSHLMFLRAFDKPVFFGHGSIPSDILSIRPKKMLNIPEASIFPEQSLVEYKGRQCIFLRTASIYAGGKSHCEMYVDPAREGAVMKWSCYIMDRLFTVLEIEHELTERGWLPSKWTRITYENPKIPIVESMHVKRRVFNPKLTDSDFKIKTTPGIVVYDHRKKSKFISAGPGEPMIPLKEWMLKHPDN